MSQHFTFKNYNEDFKCIHCRSLVSTESMLSGVINRNHCPYCLYSRHLDLHQAGDRLAACKSQMQPVALTVKKSNKKYGSGLGELMLVHLCAECGKVSINRIAADDIAENVLAIFESSQRLEPSTRALIERSGVQTLGPGDARLVHARLFGNEWATCPAGSLSQSKRSLHSSTAV